MTLIGSALVRMTVPLPVLYSAMLGTAASTTAAFPTPARTRPRKTLLEFDSGDMLMVVVHFEC